MAQVLIVYATLEGQTHKIASFISERLTDRGIAVDLHDIDNVPATIDPDAYDGVLVGGSIHMGRFQESLKTWVTNNSVGLSRRPAAFFSVCLGILERDNAQTIREERRIVTDFFSQTNWTPASWTIFAGALAYSKYGWFKKQMLRYIARRAGGATDASQDYEYTDWSEVRAFANGFADWLQGAAGQSEPKTDLTREFPPRILR